MIVNFQVRKNKILKNESRLKTTFIFLKIFFLVILSKEVTKMKVFFKKIYIGIILIFLLTALTYICNIDNLPSNIVLFEGETLALNTIYGVNIETEFSSNPNFDRIDNNKAVTVSTNAKDENEIECTGTINLSVKFLGAKVKEINVDVIEKAEVVPLGKLIGVKLYTNGVLVVGMSEISGKDNNKHKPYENSGIEEGDVIVEIDNKEVTSTNELLQEISNSKGNNINVKYIRNRRSIDNKYKSN